MMGGKLVVDSIHGVGSKFSFQLKFETIENTEEIINRKKNILREIEKPMFEGEVLICEDNGMNQMVLSEHLTRVGIKSVIAENGKIGLEMVTERSQKGIKQFDLIFMDMHMPIMDGHEATAEILKLNTGIPIVAMTANIMPDDLEVYRENGMDDYVGKPFTSQELWHCLLKFFTPITEKNN
jgi:CheY-like chemotaxis protein